MAIFLPGTTEEQELTLEDLTPREIVAELDKHVVGQHAAKRAVAIALRNRMRRQKLPPDIAEEIMPKNIIMIGPTGVGKTEIARRLAKLTNSPFLKVEASKFTEVGYVGRDVESIVRDLVDIAIDMVREDIRPSDVLRSEVVRAAGGKTVRPNTAGQKRYVDAISQSIITFGIGPAGTGKSYLAVAQAVHALQSRQVTRIILTRPAVEAGERLGFLPGDLMAKVDPYLRPLYDALYDLLEPEGAQRLLDRGTIEVAPLAFMRGRTLNNSFIILDEAQNTTPEQMKMFLTRIGFGSKCVVTGDVTQIDVPGGRSGLVGLEPVLGGIEDISFVHLSRRDIVRHKIVADIVDAYEVAEGRAGPTQ